MSLADRLAVAALSTVMSLAGCDLGAVEEATTDDDIVVPSDHPCPEFAVAPSVASLWTTQFATGDPAPLAFLIPLPADVTATVTQAYDGTTHMDETRWALDFAVPYGTTVTAAASGVVVYVKDDSDRHGYDPHFKSDANFVVIDHGAGLFSAYVHLAQYSALVEPGDDVYAGDPLATTGPSGQSTGPHLHFHVENVWSQTVPVRFIDADARACDLAPRVDDVVFGGAALARLMADDDPLSQMPPNTYANSGVSQVGGLPARLFERSRPYTVTGAVSAGQSDVYLLFLPPAGGDAIGYSRFEVSDGHFSGEIDLSLLPPGSYGLGLIAVSPGDAVVVARSVRVSVIHQL